jgi:hypothetical protein
VRAEASTNSERLRERYNEKKNKEKQLNASLRSAKLLFEYDDLIEFITVVV